ncbi:LacI family DNA-binding transcriptional regulator [Companilactobacillus zhachilii]|uniref:LacI family DNA-binding transcriptional regulator n=1 Tax=Companilactobacillus zhachilii TaxID=2304606 RepID=UPI004033D177
MATIYDIARMSGVSKSTVSRVLNGSKNVTVEKKTRVNKAIKALNYSPNTIARTMAPSISYNSIMIVSLRPSNKVADNPYFSNVIFAISSVAENHNYDIFFQTNDSPDQIMSNIQGKVKERLIQGVIFLSGTTDKKLLTQLNALKIPVIIIGMVPKVYSHLYSIDTDNYGDSYLLTEQLVKTGQKKILCLHAPEILPVSQARINGFRDCLKDNNIYFDEDQLIDGGFTMESSHNAIKEILSKRNRPKALLTTDDLKLIASFRQLRNLNLFIPKDVALAGFSNPVINELSPMSVPNVTIPDSKLGFTAAELFFSLIKGDTPITNQITISTEKHFTL